MEGMKKLEKVQSMVMFIHSQHLISPNLSSSNSDSHRFLANFLLFLMEPCGQLSIDDKCSLISQHLPKITPSLLEKAAVAVPVENKGFVGECQLEDEVKENDVCGIGLEGDSAFEDMGLIGIEAMQRANSTLEDFCRSYYMFHGLDVTQPECIFRYLPVLSFTESYIYQLDGLNEKMVNVNRSKTTDRDHRSHKEVYPTWPCRLMKTFLSEPFRPLILRLDHHGLLTDRVKKELRDGEEYWALERKLCSASEQVEISVEDVMRAIQLKSFDYRILNLLLYQLRGEEVCDLHMEFLSVSEFLVEISDDLFDYEEDVLENSFNILRMFVRIYGCSTAPAMLAKYIGNAEEKYEELEKALDPELRMRYRRRCEEATKEGGKMSGYSLGSWTIPPIIVDEELYRCIVQDSP